MGQIAAKIGQDQ